MTYNNCIKNLLDLFIQKEKFNFIITIKYKH